MMKVNVQNGKQMLQLGLYIAIGMIVYEITKRLLEKSVNKLMPDTPVGAIGDIDNNMIHERVHDRPVDRVEEVITDKFGEEVANRNYNTPTIF
jgi:hypothetical protein